MVIEYKIMIMNRVDMKYTATKDVPGIGTYFITSDDRAIRPYALLFKKIN